jgi:hypothetical protein
MSTLDNDLKDRVRLNTPEPQNIEIDKNIMQNIIKYRYSHERTLTNRIEQLKKEWDIERYLEVNAASLALMGVLMGTFVNRRWFILPGIVASFLLQHGVQGWCPPLPVLRALGARTRKEIDEELYALKILRGDFADMSVQTEVGEIMESLRK